MTSSRPLGKIWPLKVSRGAAQIGVTLVIVPESVASQLNESSGFLGPGEREYFSTLKFVRRRQSYLLGRYAAKMAVAHQVGEIDLRAIEILRGVFEQPIVHCVRSVGWCVSISHADTLAAALAFPAGHPMGIDLEGIDSTRYETILSQLSEKERKWVQAANREDTLQLATALWTAKEALSKVLCTGLMSPVQIYNLSEFTRINQGHYEGTFRNFGQYKTMTWFAASHAMSIVLPKQSTLRADGDIGAGPWC